RRLRRRRDRCADARPGRRRPLPPAPGRRPLPGSARRAGDVARLPRRPPTGAGRRSRRLPREGPVRPGGPGRHPAGVAVNRLRVLVADDSPAARTLIRGILEADPELEVVGQATDGVEAVTLAGRLAPDVITMDVDMPGVDGLEATRRIMASAPRPIVLVSGVFP